MMFNQYPYINVNDLNLDYILKQIKVMMNEVTNFVSINAIKYADPIQWDITKQYEKNTVVIDPVTGTAYISVAPVPAGVNLTRTEYWTVVFDLQSFVTKSNQNIANHYEMVTTLTATMNTNAGDWVIWGDVLYKALVNITAGDAYVVGSNIERITIEDIYNQYLNTIANILAIVGDLADLTTSDTSDIVHAINSVLDDLNLTIGDLANLTTSDTSDIVHAINSVLDDLNLTIGDLATLNTSDKTSVVNAINEVLATVINLNTTYANEIGDLAELKSIDNSNIVHAINTKPHYHATMHIDIYVAYSSGDDGNDGLTITTPVKTLDHALDIMAYSGAGAYIHIIEPGGYNISYPVFSGCMIHFDATVAGVIINWLEINAAWTKCFYDSYIHFNGISGGNLTLNLLGTKNAYLEVGKVFMQYVTVNAVDDIRLGFIAGAFQADDCIFNCKLYFSNTVAQLTTCQYSPNVGTTYPFALHIYNNSSVALSGSQIFNLSATHDLTHLISCAASQLYLRTTKTVYNAGGAIKSLVVNTANVNGTDSRINNWTSEGIDVTASFFNGTYYESGTTRFAVNSILATNLVRGTWTDIDGDINTAIVTVKDTNTNYQFNGVVYFQSSTTDCMLTFDDCTNKVKYRILMTTSGSGVHQIRYTNSTKYDYTDPSNPVSTNNPAEITITKVVRIN